MHDEQVAILPIDQVIGPKFLLRVIDKSSIEYTETRESIRRHGLFNSICTRPANERAPGKQEVVDGNLRYEIHLELELPAIPVICKSLTDEEVLSAQIQANALRQETTRSEFARQLQRIQQYKPGITLSEIAVMVKKNPIWVSRQLDLLHLSADQRHLIDCGEMPVSSAYMLAKVPAKLRTDDLVAKACVLSPSKFKDIATALIRQVMEDVRNGKLRQHFNDDPFVATPHYRGNADILREIETLTAGIDLATLSGTKHPKDWLAGWKAAHEWGLKIDPLTTEERRQATIKPLRDLKRLYEERNTNELDT